MAADPVLPPQAASKLEAARRAIASMPGAVIAFSGGADSALLLRLAVDALGARCLAVTALAPTFPPWERAEVDRLVRLLGARHLYLETRELAREEFARNQPDRCYHCQVERLRALRGIAEAAPDSVVLIGTNADDLADRHRPGRRAAVAAAVRAPLAEAGLTKQEIREASRALGLPTWDKPQLACLASRFPYGTRITADHLQQVAAAEQGLREAGFRDLRVRFHGDVGRIEVGVAELARFADPLLRTAVAAAVRAAGFRYAALDLDGFRSGRLNE
ncbi:MAG: ATP-dependent sacrificial sulfur transferase LarE, partial [Deltaproteobacteria bacterium]|nr:ATP-dependent sacrificial sulfur transferase LarE [Deltaproteobacteria bacterium]